MNPAKKFNDQLAHEIKAIVVIMDKYCSCYEQENKKIEIVKTLIEYLLILCSELCRRY